MVTIYRDKIEDIHALAGHGVILYRYENTGYKITECGQVWIQGAECWVCGKASSTTILKGDIIEHTDQNCKDGLSRYARG